MRHRHRIARNTASGLVTALCLFYSDQAFAAQDPFALPPSRDAGVGGLGNPGRENTPPAANDDVAEYTIYAEIIVNGEQKSRLVKIVTAGPKLSIHAGDAAYAGLLPIALRSGYVSLDDIDGAQWSFDSMANRLTVTMPRTSDGPNLLDLASKSGSSNMVNPPLTAVILDYDISALASDQGADFAGLVSAQLSRGNLTLQSDMRFNTAAQRGAKPVIRLNTALTLNDPGNLYRATFGDFVSATPVQSRAVRMGGIQIATDFGLRPDLITYPLPDFTGDVAVPSGLDLLVNDRRLTSGDVESGEFSIRNIPVPVGRNEIGVVLRDALGREQIRTISFHTSRKLLAPGLSQGAFNLGKLRRGFGRRSNDYGGLVTSGFYRRGLSRSFTGGVLGEAAPGFINGGISGVMTLGKFGQISAGLRASRSRIDGQANSSGHSVVVDFETLGRDFSFRLGTAQVANGYDDLASAKGDAPPQSTITASANLNLRSLGNFSLNAIEQRPQKRMTDLGRPKFARVFTASYRNTIGGKVNFFADLSHRNDGRKSTSLLLGLSMQFGGGAHVQASAVRQSGQTNMQAGFYSPDRLPGDWGFNVQASAGNFDRIAAGLSHRASWGRVDAQAEMAQGRMAARVSARGSLLFADDELFAAEQITGGFAVVRSGTVAGLPVQHENRPAGTTGATSKLLLTGIVPYVPTKISINPEDLPPEILARKLQEMIVVAPRGGTRVDLDVREYEPQLIHLLDADGVQAQPGTIVRAMPSRSEYIAGFDGIIEINAALGDTELRLQTAPNQTCFADLDQIDSNGEGGFEVKCRGKTKSFPIAAAAAK